MEKFDFIRSMYDINYLAHNRIGDVGFFYLSKAEWKNLTSLNLCTNLIIKTIIAMEILDACP